MRVNVVSEQQGNKFRWQKFVTLEKRENFQYRFVDSKENLHQLICEKYKTDIQNSLFGMMEGSYQTSIYLFCFKSIQKKKIQRHENVQAEKST